MEALHEADNLADHFGNSDAYVGLVLSTDLSRKIHQAAEFVGGSRLTH